MSSVPDIKFCETLRTLIDASPFKANRKPIWRSVHVTSAALSQYLQGQTRPRLETLVGLADFFGVSLDYLVLGRDDRQEAPGSTSFDSYVDRALSDVQATLGARTWMAARIGQELAMQIDEAAIRAAERGSTKDGIVTEEDLLTLESFSLETCLVATTLEPNAVASGPDDVIAGPCSRVVADNLKSNPPRTYQFLLPNHTEASWGASVHAVRRVLANEFGVSQERLRRCRFRITDAAAFNGSVFYHLEVGSLHHFQPILYQLLMPYISPDGWLGYATHFNTSANNMLFESSSLSTALSTFGGLWSDAQTDL